MNTLRLAFLVVVLHAHAWLHQVSEWRLVWHIRRVFQKDYMSHTPMLLCSDASNSQITSQIPTSTNLANIARTHYSRPPHYAYSFFSWKM
jgi:hypothetical protein